jgi:hypothetical protein
MPNEEHKQEVECYTTRGFNIIQVYTAGISLKQRCWLSVCASNLTIATFKIHKNRLITFTSKMALACIE